MYLDYFSLKRHPFRITPDPSLFFHGGAHGLGVVLDALVYGITTGEVILKVVGEVGSGKTMLCRMLEERLPPTVDIVYLANPNPNLSARDIIYAIAFVLKLPVDAHTDRLVVMQKLQDYLLGRHAAGASVVVFIEEAQSMPLETLEEVRLLSNLETHHHKLMQIVLFGQPELDRKLENKSIRQLRERITHSFELQPLSEQEIREYLHFRLQAAGCPWPQLFSPKAEQLLAKASAGLSRRINILAGRALLATYADPATRQGMRNSAGEILPMVQPKHVLVAIKDSAYRVDHTDIRKNLLIGAGMAALLLAGVGVGWWLNRDSGMQPVLLPVAAVEPEAVAAPTPVPVQPAAATVSSVVAENASSTTIEVTASSSPVAAAAKEVAIPPGLTALVAVRARASVPWLASLPGREGYSVQMYAVGISELDKLQDYFEFLELTDMFGDVYMCRISASGGLEAQWLVLHELFEGYSKAESFIRNLPPYLGQHQPYVRNVKGIACTN
jgi:type II secretory pathway predicted ATPase ExeA